MLLLLTIMHNKYNAHIVTILQFAESFCSPLFAFCGLWREISHIFQKIPERCSIFRFVVVEYRSEILKGEEIWFL